MASMFRPDIFEQETSFYFKNCFILPKYLQMKYSLPKTEESEFIQEFLSQRDFSVKNVSNVDQSSLTELFMRSCFNKCKKFVLEDWIDYDELDCTMKCALVHKKSFDVLQNSLSKTYTI